MSVCGVSPVVAPFLMPSSDEKSNLGTSNLIRPLDIGDFVLEKIVSMMTLGMGQVMLGDWSLNFTYMHKRFRQCTSAAWCTVSYASLST